jgi:hypothetical protein
MSTTTFYIKRTFATGNVDHLGPYLDNQEFAVAMQRGLDCRKGLRITRWEWVQGEDA